MYHVTFSLQDDDNSEEAEVTEDTTHDHAPPVPMATSSEISLSQSTWDDETPGPSYSTLGPPQTDEGEPEQNQLGGTGAAAEQREHNDDDDGNDEEEECMIVGYVKPMAERTPELVQLSSDSTEEEEGGNVAASTETVTKVEPSLPSHEQAPISPKSYPSTSHTERGENLERSREQDTGKHSHHRRKDRTPRRGFRNASHSLSGSRSQTSSESSPRSGASVKLGRSPVRSSCREPRSHHLLGRSPTIFAARAGTSSEEPDPTRSISARDKSSKSFSPWDTPGHDGGRKKKRRKRRRERETERSRSPHRESRHCHGDRELWLRSSSSSSSDADSRREKPAGKRKYKTRHLERTARRRSRRKSRERERERSPSVEIIFERRASDAPSRGRKHKRRTRRREREQNSPTIITIDSDSSSHHSADRQDRHTEANDHTADYRNRLLDGDEDVIANDPSADYQDRTADDSEHVSDFSDHTIDYQEHLGEFSDRTTDDKDCITDVIHHTTDYKDHTSDQNCGTVFSDRTAQYKDGAAGVSSQTSHYKDKVTEVGDYTTDCRNGVPRISDQATECRDHTASVSAHAADSKHSVPEVNSADCKGHVKQLSGCRVKLSGDAEVNCRSSACREPLLDISDSPDDFLDSVADLGTRGEPNASVLDMLNLEHCLVDVVQAHRRVDEDNRRAATLLSDARLLELEDSLLGDGQGNVTVDQQEAGLGAHRDQSETEVTQHADVMRDSRGSAEMSPDV